MVNQVNNIIFDLIVSGRGVWLPDIAALRVVRRPAQHGASSRTILPPRLAVDFTSHREGVSIVDEIARVASIDESAAHDIYDRWIEKCLSNGVLTIAGIGVLRGKSFVADNALTELLNADAGRAVKVAGRRRSLLRIAIVSAVLLFVSAAGALYWFLCRDMRYMPDNAANEAERSAMTVMSSNETSADATEQVAKLSEHDFSQEESARLDLSGTDIGVEAADADTSSVSVEASEPSVAADTEAAAAKAQPATESDIRYRVIIGSYSTRSNAERAMADAQKRVSGLRCEIRPLGRLFAVAAFGAPTREECEEFIREHRREFPQAWTNPARK